MFKSGWTAMQANVLPVLTSVILLGLLWTESLGGEISARIEPAYMPVDGAAQLTVSLSGSGTGMGKPRLPSVAGLEFVPTGTSSQVQYSNGEMSSLATHIYRIRAQKTGNFTIPPITAEVDGRVEQTQPLTLAVVKSGGIQSPQRQGTQKPVRSAPSRVARPKQPGPVGKEAAFLELVPRKGQLYLGEMIPVEIRAYFRDGLGVSIAPPRLEGDAFALHDLSKEPEKSRVQVGDGIYTMLKWQGAISAIKEGRYPITARLDATIQVPRPATRRPMFGRGFFGDHFFNNDSFFNDDFFNQFFGGFEENEVALSSPRLRIRVKPLPEKGRPENFSGAVGQFKLSVSAKPTTVTVGDPITLHMTLKGRGNFDRVAAPTLEDETGWKTYSATDTFEGSDPHGYRGTKRFEQAIVPQHAGLREIPPVSFSYFDTHRKNYVTLKTKAIPLSLTGTPIARRVETDRAAKRVEADGLIPIGLQPGRRSATLEPVLTRPWFWATQALPLSALVAGLLLHRRHRKITENPGWVRGKETDRRVNDAEREMKIAVQRGDTEAFVAAGLRAVRLRLGELWGVRPQSVTLAEIRARRPDGSDAIRRVFAAADALAYSGQSIRSESLQQWHQEIVAELDVVRAESGREVR